MGLADEYRPGGFSEFIGNQKAVGRFKAIVARAKAKGGTLAVWIDGASGIGKSTLAKLAAVELGANASLDVIELDGPKCDGKAVDGLETTLSFRAMGGGFRVVIVDEAHSMTPKGVQLWLTLLESLPNKTAVFFTTTARGDLFGNFDGPLKSRCVEISLTNQGLAELFAERAQEIAEAEDLGGAAPKDYLALVKRYKNNMRRVLSRIQGLEMLRDPSEQLV